MKLLLIAILATVAMPIYTQTTTNADRILYGAVTVDTLLQPPYSLWYNTNYDTYTPTKSVVITLKKNNWKGYQFTIYFGSWCGDSKREVPRMLKVLNSIGIPSSQVTLIALGGRDSLYKQSAQRTEDAYGIYRVPTLIITKHGNLLGSINESPVITTEHDMLAIIQGKAYTPNYASYNTIIKWQNEGILTSPNVSAVTLANSLKYVVKSESELNTAGYVLQSKGYLKEALKVLKINYNLYPTSANVCSSLGDAFIKNNEPANALQLLTLAIGYSKDNPTALAEILELWYKAKKMDTK